jgi:hypothetical protein
MRRITRVHLDWAALLLFLWTGMVGMANSCCLPAITAMSDDTGQKETPDETRIRARAMLEQMDALRMGQDRDALRSAELAERAFQLLLRKHQIAKQLQLQRELQLVQAGNRNVNSPRLTVEQLVFGRDGGVEVARQQLEILQQNEVGDLKNTCQLSEAQKTKVALLCQGDIKRFFDRIEMVTARQLAGDDQAEIERESRVLVIRFNSGLFRESSLLKRTLPNLLTPEQLAKFKDELARRENSTHQAAVRQVVEIIFPLRIPEKDSQALEAFLLSETLPPPISCGYDPYFILLQMGRIPEAQLHSRLRASQFVAFKRLTAKANQLRPAMEIAGYFVDQANEKDD